MKLDVDIIYKCVKKLAYKRKIAVQSANKEVCYNEYFISR